MFADNKTHLQRVHDDDAESHLDRSVLCASSAAGLETVLGRPVLCNTFYNACFESYSVGEWNGEWRWGAGANKIN